MCLCSGESKSRSVEERRYLHQPDDQILHFSVVSELKILRDILKISHKSSSERVKTPLTRLNNHCHCMLARKNHLWFLFIIRLHSRLVWPQLWYIHFMCWLLMLWTGIFPQNHFLDLYESSVPESRGGCDTCGDITDRGYFTALKYNLFFNCLGVFLLTKEGWVIKFKLRPMIR